MWNKRVEIIVNENELKRRVMRFYLLESRLVLDEDIDEERETKRHKYKRKAIWSRLDQRNSRMDRREVPKAVIEAALEDIRNQITYDPQD